MLLLLSVSHILPDDSQRNSCWLLTYCGISNKNWLHFFWNVLSSSRKCLYVVDIILDAQFSAMLTEYYSVHLCDEPTDIDRDLRAAADICTAVVRSLRLVLLLNFYLYKLFEKILWRFEKRIRINQTEIYFWNTTEHPKTKILGCPKSFVTLVLLFILSACSRLLRTALRVFIDRLY